MDAKIPNSIKKQLYTIIGNGGALGAERAPIEQSTQLLGAVEPGARRDGDGSVAVGTLRWRWRRLSDRDRALGKALLTALASKGGGMVVQIIAIPYAVRVLGASTFGAYAAAMALFNWIAVIETSLGVSLVRRVVVATTQRDRGAMGALIGTTVSALLISVTGVAVLVLSIGTLPAVRAMVSGVEASGVMSLAFFAAVFAAARLVTGIVPRVRAGMQLTYINNLYGGLANLASAVALFACLQSRPTALTLMTAMAVPILVANVISGIVLWIRSPLVRGRWQFDSNVVNELAKEGGWLALGQGGVFLERQAPLLLLVGVGSAAMAGAFACAVQTLTIIAGVAAIISNPLMPAVAEAIESRQCAWWRSRVALLEKINLGCGCLCVILAALFGPASITALFGSEVLFGRIACAGLALWATVLLLAHLYYTVLLASGQFRTVGLLMGIQGVMVFTVCAIGFRRIESGELFWIAAALTTACTYVPWRIRAMSHARSQASCE